MTLGEVDNYQSFYVYGMKWVCFRPHSMYDTDEWISVCMYVDGVAKYAKFHPSTVVTML